MRPVSHWLDRLQPWCCPEGEAQPAPWWLGFALLALVFSPLLWGVVKMHMPVDMVPVELTPAEQQVFEDYDAIEVAAFSGLRTHPYRLTSTRWGKTVESVWHPAERFAALLRFRLVRQEGQVQLWVAAPDQAKLTRAAFSRLLPDFVDRLHQLRLNQLKGRSNTPASVAPDARTNIKTWESQKESRSE